VNATIFVVGLFVSLLLAGGLIFTVLEVRRIERTQAGKDLEDSGRRLPSV